MQWYAIAAAIALVVGAIVWGVRRSSASGRWKAERDALKESLKRDREARKVLGEGVADESEWLRRQRRLARMREQAKS